MGSIFSTARPSLVGSWHPIYVNYLGAQNSRSPACTLAFYFLMHFLFCSLHFFEDVCITNYKQGVKGGMNSMLTSNYQKYVSHENQCSHPSQLSTGIRTHKCINLGPLYHKMCIFGGR